MAPLAALLASDGHRVTGSDGTLYPPMSTLLEAAGIRPFEGFAAAHLDPRRGHDWIGFQTGTCGACSPQHQPKYPKSLSASPNSPSPYHRLKRFLRIAAKLASHPKSSSALRQT
jgi:hypothetical protein